MSKTLSNIVRQDKEKFKRPKRSHEVIPIKKLYEDGMCRHSGNKYSMCYGVTDINLTSESDETEEELMLTYIELLKSFDSSAIVKLTVNKHRRNMHEFNKKHIIKAQADDLDCYREDLNSILSEAVQDKCKSVVDRFFTVSVVKRNEKEAREFFEVQRRTFEQKLLKLKADLKQLNAKERMEVYYGFLRADSADYFEFDYDECLKGGLSFKDYIAPGLVEKHMNYLKIDERYFQSLVMLKLPSSVSNTIIYELMASCDDICISIDIISLPTEEAVSITERKLFGNETNKANFQRKQNARNNFSAEPPYQTLKNEKQLKEVLNDLTMSDQHMHECVFTITISEDDMQTLYSKVAEFRALAMSKNFNLNVAYFQQLDALQTCVPFGARKKIDVFRTLLSGSLASFQPFNSKKIDHDGGYFYGINQDSKSMIFINNDKLKNGNQLVFGVSGSGKSFFVKLLIANYYLTDNDCDIILIDPEAEYGALVEALHGETITISSTSKTHINPLDLNKEYDESTKLPLKTEMVLSIFDIISDGGIGPKERSIIGRCVESVYKDYIENNFSGKTPTLEALRQELLAQGDPIADQLALYIEIYSKGSLDTFAYETNVNVNNRLINYDIHDLSEQLQSIAMLVVLDNILNRIAHNRENGRKTFVFIDEFYLLLMHEYSAKFFYKLWKRVRKHNAYCTGITQDVTDLLQNHSDEALLSNSELVIMLNQAPRDCERLAEMYNLSAANISHITNAPIGTGLLKVGKDIVPFENVVPKGTRLYELVKTSNSKN